MASNRCMSLRHRLVALAVVGADLFHRPDRLILQAAMMMSLMIGRRGLRLLSCRGPIIPSAWTYCSWNQASEKRTAEFRT